jgi:hypothetical protein
MPAWRIGQRWEATRAPVQGNYTDGPCAIQVHGLFFINKIRKFLKSVKS